MAPKKTGKKGSYKFKYFDWSKVFFESSIGIFGSRGGGKSNLTISNLSQNKLPRVFAICDSPEVHNKFACVPYIYRFEEYDHDWVASFLKCQYRISAQINAKLKTYKKNMMKAIKDKFEADKKLLPKALENLAKEKGWQGEELKKKLAKYHDREMAAIEAEFEKAKEELLANYAKLYAEWRKPYAVEIFIDDCSSDKTIMKSLTLKKMINNGRHYIIRVTITIQFMMDWPSHLRGGLDYIVIFGDDRTDDLMKYHKYYAGCFRSFGEFRHILDEITSLNKGRGCMIINTRVRSKNLEDKVFIGGAKNMDVEDVEVGSEKYRMFDEYYGKIPDGEIDPRGSSSNKKGGNKKGDSDDDESESDDDGVTGRLLNNSIKENGGGGNSNNNKKDDWQQDVQKKILQDMEQQAKRQQRMMNKQRPRVGKPPGKPKNVVIHM